MTSYMGNVIAQITQSGSSILTVAHQFLNYFFNYLLTFLISIDSVVKCLSEELKALGLFHSRLWGSYKNKSISWYTLSHKVHPTSHLHNFAVSQEGMTNGLLYHYINILRGCWITVYFCIIQIYFQTYFHVPLYTCNIM